MFTLAIYLELGKKDIEIELYNYTYLGPKFNWDKETIGLLWPEEWGSIGPLLVTWVSYLGLSNFP